MKLKKLAYGLQKKIQVWSPPRQDEGNGWLLLNDTKLIEANHLGSGAVTDYIHGQMASRGLVHVGSANTAEDLRNLEGVLKRSNVSLIVFNGEGSLHSGRQRILDLLEFCTLARAAGKRTVLINSVWQNNPVQFGRHLRGFDIVSVRESRSLTEIKLFRTDAEIVPDLTFAALADDARLLEPISEEAMQLGVIDSVYTNVAAALFTFARWHRLPFYTMGFLGQRFEGQKFQDNLGRLFPQPLLRLASLSHDRSMHNRQIPRTDILAAVPTKMHCHSKQYLQN